MRARFRSSLTYANLMATIAVFIALGGTTVAAVKIDGRSIKANSVTGKQVKESSLAKVPRAKQADTIGGKSAGQLVTACPPGTVDTGTVCFQSQLQPAATPAQAFKACMTIQGYNPSASQLMGAAAAGKITIASEELAGDVTGNGAKPFLTVNADGPVTALGAADTAPFRCGWHLRNG